MISEDAEKYNVNKTHHFARKELKGAVLKYVAKQAALPADDFILAFIAVREVRLVLKALAAICFATALKT